MYGSKVVGILNSDNSVYFKNDISFEIPLIPVKCPVKYLLR